MKVVAELTLTPVGVGTSLSKYVQTCEQVITQCGLHHEVHANGTDVEGELEDVLGAVRLCLLRLHDEGVPRVQAHVSIDSRPDQEPDLERMARKGEASSARSARGSGGGDRAARAAASDEDVSTTEL